MMRRFSVSMFALSAACAGPGAWSDDPEVVRETESAVTCSAWLERYPVAGPHNGGWDRNATTFSCEPHPGSSPDNSDYYRGAGGANHQSGHLGNDIFGDRGTPIVVARSGVVDSVANDSIGGLNVTIRDECGWYYYYAHLNSVDYEYMWRGNWIAAGTSVGTLGNTGQAMGTQPHLHFSVFPGNYYSGIDPFPLLETVDATACAPEPLDPARMSCGDWAAAVGYKGASCEWNGNGACGGMGPITNDCDRCCDTSLAVEMSCGDWAAFNGVENAACEWNGNETCRGAGATTWDCDHCCAQ